MTDAVRYYRCPTCNAVQWAGDLGTPWAGVGWYRGTGGWFHWCRATEDSDCDAISVAAEPLPALPSRVAREEES